MHVYLTDLLLIYQNVKLNEFRFLNCVLLSCLSPPFCVLCPPIVSLLGLYGKSENISTKNCLSNFACKFSAFYKRKKTVENCLGALNHSGN